MHLASHKLAYTVPEPHPSSRHNIVPTGRSWEPLKHVLCRQCGSLPSILLSSAIGQTTMLARIEHPDIVDEASECSPVSDMFPFLSFVSRPIYISYSQSSVASRAPPLQVRPVFTFLTSVYILLLSSLASKRTLLSAKLLRLWTAGFIRHAEYRRWKPVYELWVLAVYRC
jgi:hypothetical protein